MPKKLLNSADDMNYAKPDDIFVNAKSIIESARSHAYAVANVSLIKRNWLIGIEFLKSVYLEKIEQNTEQML